MAEQRTLAKEKKEQEMRETYEKEQQTYQHKMLLAKKDEDKIKLGLNFMYDVPPGLKKDEDKEDGENKEEVKFEWQKNAPRATYAKKLGLDVHDQPFGICVRNVKCFRCGKWGHQNIDRECPMFSENKGDKSSSSALDSLCLSDPLRLISDMKKEHGLTLRRSVIGSEIDPMAENQQILDSDDDNDPEVDITYIESLTDKQKKRLLKKLEKLEKKKAKKQKQEEIESSRVNPRKRLRSDSEYERRDPQNSHKEPRKHRRKQKSQDTNDMRRVGKIHYTERYSSSKQSDRTKKHRK